MKTRGNQKLMAVVTAFSFDFRGKVVLDIGSSTGGFTEVALNGGAKKIIAVEKGTNQMIAPLRFSPNVELYEKTDIFDVVSETHQGTKEGIIISTPDVILADVSFMSLKPVLEYAKTYLAGPQTEFLVMLKPQFEAEAKDLNRGVVKNEHIRRTIIKDFETWLLRNHFKIEAKKDNTLAGRKGNIERFYLLHCDIME